MIEIGNHVFENVNDLVNSDVELTPSEYFELIKNSKHQINDEGLDRVYNNCLELLEGFKETKQKRAINKVLFHLACIEKEREIVNMGIDTFIYRDDIEFYIDLVGKDVVKVIDLEDYEREIPYEIRKVITEVEDKFDKLIVMFTDYTGKVERQVEKERRDKDPILFGVFVNKSARSVVDRFYYIGDWEDEFCDLTLDKLVNETKRLGNRNIVRTIKTPEDLDELREQLNSLSTISTSYLSSSSTNTASYIVNNEISESNTEKPVKGSLFNNIKHALKRKKK